MNKDKALLKGRRAPSNAHVRREENDQINNPVLRIGNWSKEPLRQIAGRTKAAVKMIAERN